jgi:hypothetical protein
VFCSQCGTENSRNDTYCIVCGSSLRMAGDGGPCVHCSARLSSDARYCSSCGESVAEPDDRDTLFAGPSFDADNLEDVDLADLPDWLRDLAPRDDHRPSAPVSPSQPTPDDLPDWLRDTGDDDIQLEDFSETPSTVDPVHHHPAAEFELVSDDELSDWLTTLGDEDGGDGDHVITSAPYDSGAREPVAASSNAVALLAEAPAVSRAWLREGRMVATAVADEARRDFAPLQSLETEQPTHQASDVETIRFPTTMPAEVTMPIPEETGSSTSFWTRHRMRLVTLALFLIVVLLLAFLLIQSL